MLKDNKSFFSVLSFMALLHVKHIVEKFKRFHGLNDVWSQGIGEGLVICVIFMLRNDLSCAVICVTLQRKIILKLYLIEKEEVTL